MRFSSDGVLNIAFVNGKQGRIAEQAQSFLFVPHQYGSRGYSLKAGCR